MKKAKFVSALAAMSGQTTAATEAVLDAMGAVVSKELGEGGEVTLPGVGRLATKERAARSGRNPSTGETIQIAAKTAVTFKVTKPLADHVA